MIMSFKCLRTLNPDRITSSAAVKMTRSTRPAVSTAICFIFALSTDEISLPGLFMAISL
jgi:hypothetical protein